MRVLFLEKKSNETEGRFRRLMQMRMDMNAAEIHNNSLIHVVEAGFSGEPPMSCDAEVKLIKV